MEHFGTTNPYICDYYHYDNSFEASNKEYEYFPQQTGLNPPFLGLGGSARNPVNEVTGASLFGAGQPLVGDIHDEHAHGDPNSPSLDSRLTPLSDIMSLPPVAESTEYFNHSIPSTPSHELNALSLQPGLPYYTSNWLLAVPPTDYFTGPVESWLSAPDHCSPYAGSNDQEASPITSAPISTISTTDSEDILECLHDPVPTDQVANATSHTPSMEGPSDSQNTQAMHQHVPCRWDTCKLEITVDERGWKCAFRSHFEDHHPDLRDKKSCKWHKCHSNGKEYTQPFKHMARHMPKDALCSNCGRLFGRLDNLRRHQKLNKCKKAQTLLL